LVQRTSLNRAPRQCRSLVRREPSSELQHFLPRPAWTDCPLQRVADLTEHLGAAGHSLTGYFLDGHLDRAFVVEVHEPGIVGEAPQSPVAAGLVGDAVADDEAAGEQRALGADEAN
jgi:hypothetical protein